MIKVMSSNGFIDEVRLLFLGIWRLKLAVIYSEFNQLLMTLISFKLSGLAMKCLFVFEV